MQIIKHHALKWPGLLLDLVLPPRCPMTGALVGRQGALDPEYWAKLNFIRKPFCVTCGNPFANAITGEMTCGACMEAPPIYGRGRAVLRYDDASAGMILKYKHADGTQLAHIMAHFMMQGGSDVLRKADLLIPVPLHRWRLLKRRYNQAGLLANSLSKQCGIAVSHHALRRTKSTPPQGRKTKNERLENIHGVFAVPEKYLRIVQGKNIVLLDDVYTSGATVNECAKVLLKAGAKSVDVLAVAKVVRE